ncbi:MAG: sulfurtransferase-like selenium metabolism protein YedF [Clostridia bacterium]|nr:sulfurtransferase-like selenium metabolism protein YedF [Clostridia bacterium]
MIWSRLKNFEDMRGCRDIHAIAGILEDMGQQKVSRAVEMILDEGKAGTEEDMTREGSLKVEVRENHPDFYIHIDNIEEEDDLARLSPELGSEFQQVFLVTSAFLGRGDDELGRSLMEDFLRELSVSEVVPQSVVFINSGVMLLCEDSNILQELMNLERRKVRFFACEKSLDRYGLRQKLCVGTPIKIYTLVNYLAGANKVVTLG